MTNDRNNKALVLYHADMDGFAAACAVAKRLGGCGEYRAVQYGDPCPIADVNEERDVYVVDFSWPLADMRGLLRAAPWMVWADHHKTSATDAETLSREMQGVGGCVYHDETRSGAVLAWETLAYPLPTPRVLEYVQDRDLWRWALPQSREISLALGLLWPLERSNPAECYERFLAQDVDALVPIGVALRESQSARVERLAKRAEPVDLDGRRALAVNATGDISEIGHYLLKECGTEVGLVYFREGPGRWVWSLRSEGDIDVSEIARARGGGGHRNAAGCTMPHPPECCAPPAGGEETP